MDNYEQILIAASDKTVPVPVILVSPDEVETELEGLDAKQAQWARANGFSGKQDQILLLPGEDGSLIKVLAGTGDKPIDPFIAGNLPKTLPDGCYELRGDFENMEILALGFLLGAYEFSRYRKAANKKLKLVCPENVDREHLLRLANGSRLARDLINTASNDMGPQELEDAARQLATDYGAKVDVTIGDQLAQGFPLIHAVGRGSERKPRLIDLVWGDANAPKLTLVGKGVVFDTGGLDIKPASSMLLMKKDMGGAANVLGLALMIMDAKLPVRLRVLIPAVENAVGADAYRPSDVICSRKGISVEVGNTDAEGRLVLADALALADEERPDLLIDMATLTGAARVALGPDLPPFYTDDASLAHSIMRTGTRVNDPVWRLPLWPRYNDYLKSKIADCNNAGVAWFAGSIVAALFLKQFVEQANDYAHFDIFGWTPDARPGYPVGGEAQAIRTIFALVSDRYC